MKYKFEQFNTEIVNPKVTVVEDATIIHPTRQQRRFAERLIQDEAKIEFIAQKQSEARLIEWDKERSAIISKRAEVALCCILIGFSYLFLFHG